MAVAEDAYPPPILSRQGPSPTAPRAAAGVAPAPPRTRVIPFSIIASAGNRSSRSSVLLKGPALVRHIHVNRWDPPTASNSWEIGKAASAVVETNVAATVSKPFTSLVDALLFGTGAVFNANATIGSSDVTGGGAAPETPLGIIVQDTEFFLVVSVQCGTGGTSRSLVGHVVVLEQVSPEALANFL